MSTTTIQSVAPRKVPHVHGWPILGNEHALKRNRLSFLKYMAQRGDIVKYDLGFSRNFLVNAPELVEKVMAEQGGEADRGERMRGGDAREDLVTSKSQEHRHQRKLLAPFFQPRHVATYANTIVRYAEEVPQQWSDGAVIDLYPSMKSITSKVLGQSFLGTDIVDSDGTLSKIMVVAFQTVVKKVFSAFTIKLPWNIKTPSLRKAIAARKASDDYKAIIVQKAGVEGGNLSERRDLFALLSQTKDESGDEIPIAKVLNECWGLVLGGFHTTPTALTWTWYLLCQHPEVYQKLQQEVDSVLGGRTPTYDDLPSLTYCSQVFKEVLRLYPPAPMIRREAQHDFDLDGCHIPQGTVITMSPYLMHRKPEYYPNPEQFDPERFSPEREKKLPRYAFMPFGGGARVCLGNHFVLMEGPLLIATMAQRLTFSLVPGQPPAGFDLEHGLALVPKGKIEMLVKKR